MQVFITVFTIINQRMDPVNPRTALLFAIYVEAGAIFVILVLQLCLMTWKIGKQGQKLFHGTVTLNCQPRFLLALCTHSHTIRASFYFTVHSNTAFNLFLVTQLSR